MSLKLRLLPIVLVASTLSLHAALTLPLYQDETVHLVFRSDAEALSYSKPLIGTLKAVCRDNETVVLPNLQARFKGFCLVDDFAAGETVSNGKTIAQWRFRLTPEAIAPWQLTPFVFTIKNRHTGETRDGLTRLVTFPTPPDLPMATGTPEADLAPEWVAPGWATIRWWLLMALGVIALIAATFPLLKRLKRVLHERTLSPEERAALELARLLAEGLLAQGQHQRFYYGLTNVVRRYFERAYALRATRQTTQEFLNGAAKDERITAEERAALTQFLTLADKIKFAGLVSTTAEAEAATDTVRELLAQAATHRQTLEAQTTES